MVKSKIILAGFWAHTHCEESFSKQIIDNGIDVIPFKISKYFQGKWGKYLNAIPFPVGPMLKLNRDLLTFINKNDVDYIFLGAWNFKEEIFKKEKKFIKRGGKFITHVPFPKII